MGDLTPAVDRETLPTPSTECTEQSEQSSARFRRGTIEVAAVVWDAGCTVTDVVCGMRGAE